MIVCTVIAYDVLEHLFLSIPRHVAAKHNTNHVEECCTTVQLIYFCDIVSRYT